MWGAVGLIRDDREEGETPSENYQRSIADIGTSAATIHISVSYTHLDVYKRQVYELGTGYFEPTNFQLWNGKNMDCSINDRWLVADLIMVFSLGRTEKL